MGIFEPLLHFFTPRHTNNHKAKALHVSAISTYITVLLVFQILLSAVARFSPGILGYASNITANDLLRYTNEKREAAGVGRLVLNDQLSQAAAGKAADMFTGQYWAHTSPAGRDPWSFITTAGYNYLFAGENLARDFGDSKSVVEAWINSPSHRDNILNPRYKEIGFAVVNGKYAGYETTLVVQLFGTKPGGTPTVAETAPLPTPAANEPASPAGMILNTQSKSPVKIDILDLTKKTSTGLVTLLLGVLVVDGILVAKRKTVRLSGHNFAHLILLIAVLVALNVIGRGIIL